MFVLFFWETLKVDSTLEAYPQVDMDTLEWAWETKAK